MNRSPAVSPLLEEVSCTSDGVSLPLSGGCVQNSCSDDHPSAPTESKASRSGDLDTETACKYNGRVSRRSSLREHQNASLPLSHRSSLNVRFNPVVYITPGASEPPTPDVGCLVALDAGHTPHTTSDPVREHRVALIEGPTACYPASSFCDCGSGGNTWVDSSRMCERLSIDAGSTPRRSNKPVVSFLTVSAHDASAEVDSPVGATQWAQALALSGPANSVVAP